MNDIKELPPEQEMDEEVPLLCSQRWKLVYIGFVGFGVVYSLRVNISVAIVCMVKNPIPVVDPNLWNATNFTTTATLVEISCPAAAMAASRSNDATNFPAMHAMWGRWAPPLERSKLTALCYSGMTIGNVVTFSTSGLLCAYGFDNGWGSIFYITVTSAVSLNYLVQENSYVVATITDLFNITVPWLKMAKAPCLWACLTAQVCSNWTIYTLLTNIPTFMEEVLMFDIKANGALSSITYICQFVSAILSGTIADTLRSRKIFSTTATRKIFQSIAFLGAGGCLIGTGFCNCEYRALAVGLLSLAVALLGMSQAGYVVNHVDFAPKYAGVLFGITNTFTTIPGMTAPLLAGYLTPNNTPEEWRNVFYVCAGFDAFGLVIFCLFASGDLQDWAKDELFEVEIEVKAAINEVQTPENENLNRLMVT